MASNSSQPTSFILPDLVFHCTYPLIYHPNGDEVAKQSIAWLESNCHDLSPKGRRALHSLQAGELAAFCYNSTTRERLRVVSDFLTYFFHLDNISDGMMTRETDVLSDVVMNALRLSDRYMPTATTSGKSEQEPAEELYPAKLARDFWTRCVANAGPGVQKRFKETFALFFESVKIQAKACDAGTVPDLESYIDLRRNNSGELVFTSYKYPCLANPSGNLCTGCKPCLVLIEYALDIDLPDCVVEHPVIQELNRWTNDFVSWTNDIFSYNVEQARGDTFNMIVILMKYHGHTLQNAVDYVGDLCAQTMAGFERDCDQLPSWGPKIDAMVQKYVEGLRSWIVGSLHWSFQTHRYFGINGDEVKKTRFVPLLLLQV